MPGCGQMPCGRESSHARADDDDVDVGLGSSAHPSIVS
jgi:hypothetical protein